MIEIIEAPRASKEIVMITGALESELLHVPVEGASG